MYVFCEKWKISHEHIEHTSQIHVIVSLNFLLKLFEKCFPFLASTKNNTLLLQQPLLSMISINVLMKNKTVFFKDIQKIISIVCLFCK